MRKLTEELRIGNLIRTEMIDQDFGWQTFHFVAEVVRVGKRAGKYMPDFAYRITESDHPNPAWGVGCVVDAGETGPLDEFEIVQL